MSCSMPSNGGNRTHMSGTTSVYSRSLVFDKIEPRRILYASPLLIDFLELMMIVSVAYIISLKTPGK